MNNLENKRYHSANKSPILDALIQIMVQRFHEDTNENLPGVSIIFNSSNKDYNIFTSLISNKPVIWDIPANFNIPDSDRYKLTNCDFNVIIAALQDQGWHLTVDSNSNIFMIHVDYTKKYIVPIISEDKRELLLGSLVLFIIFLANYLYNLNYHKN